MLNFVFFGFEEYKNLVSMMFSIASCQISLRTVRGTLVCFFRGVKFYGHMSHSSVLLGRHILVGTHTIYTNGLIFVIS